MKTGGTAFPALNFIIPQDLNDEGVHRLGETQGMTLRDYLAAKAMQGLLVVVANGDDLADKDLPSDTPLSQVAASQAYHIADAMLSEREK